MRFTSDSQRKLVMGMLRGHIKQLAKSGGIKINYHKLRSGYFTTEFTRTQKGLNPKIFIPKINTPADYFAALHEIGHIGGSLGKQHFRNTSSYVTKKGIPVRRDLPRDQIFGKELNVWRFVQNSAIIKPTRADEQRHARYLATYAGYNLGGKQHPLAPAVRKMTRKLIRKPGKRMVPGEFPRVRKKTRTHTRKKK